MKVYVVTHKDTYYNSMTIGVFNSRAEAEKALKENNSTWDIEYCQIEQFEIGKLY